MRVAAAIFNRLKGWRFSGTPDQGEAQPHWPCNYWEVCKQPAGKVILRDPLYGYKREFLVYEGDFGGRRHAFAVDEVSNGVFAVFERLG